MNCYVSAMLGVGLLGASAATLTVTEEQQNALKTVLSPDLIPIYENIIAERRNQYIHGLLIGLVVAFAVLYKFRVSNLYYKMTAFLSIALTTAVLYYMLMPKSDYMLNHLKSETENKAWLAKYKTMKSRYLIGFLLGAAATIPFSMIMC